MAQIKSWVLASKDLVSVLGKGLPHILADAVGVWSGHMIYSHLMLRLAVVSTPAVYRYLPTDTL